MEKLRGPEFPTDREEFLPKAERAIKFTEALYKIAGPQMGAYLVEANIVLTLAGVRGQTEFFINEPAPGDYAALRKMDDFLRPQGLSMRLVGQERKGARRVSIESLEGYAYVSRRTKLPGVYPFDSEAGWDGFRKWNGQVVENLKHKKKNGFYPPHFDLNHILAGVHKGYPDRAILDAVDAWGRGKRRGLTISDLLYVKLYGGAEPNYHYYQKHASHLEIVSHQKEWGKILEDFYNAEWHQRIRKEQEFIRARQKIEVYEKEKT